MTSWSNGWRRSALGRILRAWVRRPAAGVAIVVLLGTCAASTFPDTTAGDAGRVRRLGVVGFYNPRLMYMKYQELVDYLSETTGDRWELAITLHYDETVRSLCAGDLDVAYLGPFTYLRAQAACGARPVVRLNTAGNPTYTSLIMVRKDSPFKTVGDLRGSVFAFGSPLSTSSHLVPRLMLRKAGLRVGTDIVCSYFGHHDRAARAVLLGEAAACGVRDIVGERFTGRGLRVLARSSPIPNFPLVVTPGAPADFRHELVTALVERPAHDPTVRQRMRGWDVELAGGFAPADEKDYLPVMELVDRVFGRMGLTAPPAKLMCGGSG